MVPLGVDFGGLLGTEGELRTGTTRSGTTLEPWRVPRVGWSPPGGVVSARCVGCGQEGGGGGGGGGAGWAHVFRVSSQARAAGARHGRGRAPPPRAARRPRR